MRVQPARGNPAGSRQLVGTFAGGGRKNPQEMPICNVYHRYRTQVRRGKRRGKGIGEWAGREGAMACQGRASGMCNRLHTGRMRFRMRC